MTHPKNHRILLVEDNDLNRVLVRTVLARSDHQVAQHVSLVDAVDLAAARAELATTSFDVVLLDMHLPDGHGLDLAQELTAQQGRPRPVIIALTASVLPEQQDTVLAAGCDDFLGKPYRPQQLIDTLAVHLLAQDHA
jgi:two-component system KDP operon response regulator KdpE